jgi:hypothetical protein
LCQKIRREERWAPPKRVRARGIMVSKNEGWERGSSLLRHSIALRGGLYRRSKPFSSPVLPPLREPAEGNQNNIRSASGTPLDSGRFRQSPGDQEEIRKK